MVCLSSGRWGRPECHAENQNVQKNKGSPSDAFHRRLLKSLDELQGIRELQAEPEKLSTILIELD